MKPISHFRPTPFTLAGAAALVLACSAEGIGLEEPVETSQENLGYYPVSNSTPGLRTYGAKWFSGMAPVKLTTKATSACFLNTVGGSFLSDSDKVEIKAMVEGGVESWYLTGTTGTGTHNATAFCALNVPVIPGSEKSWQTGPQVDLVSPSTGRACFLTAVWGNFGDFSPTVDSIQAQQLGAKWVLSGFSGGGSAKCVERASFSPIVLPNAGAPTPITFPNSTNHSNSGPVLCALTQVAGKFRGAALRVYSRKLTAVQQWDWAIDTTANTSPAGGSVHGAGGCIL